MMSLSMVIIASMIGVRGLGSQVMTAVGNGYLGLGLISGLRTTWLYKEQTYPI